MGKRKTAAIGPDQRLILLRLRDIKARREYTCRSQLARLTEQKTQVRAELATLQRQQRQGRQRWKALLTETGLYTPEALKRFKYQLALCHHEDCLLQEQISALRSQLKALHDERAGVQSAIHKLQIAQEKVDIIKEL